MIREIELEQEDWLSKLSNNPFAVAGILIFNDEMCYDSLTT